jgi:cAMP-specific phosphodiesterase 4
MVRILLNLDTAILENYSISELYKTVMIEKNNIMIKFLPEEYRICRKRVVETILATDMAFHQKNLNNIKSKLEQFNIKKGRNLDKMIQVDNLNKTFENQQLLLNLAVHAVDIGAPGKKFKICEQWRERVYEEFFKQGDLEREQGMPISLLCDRNTTHPVKSQIGFITFVVQPTFEALNQFLPESSELIENLQTNIKKYKCMVEEEEKKLSNN